MLEIAEPEGTNASDRARVVLSSDRRDGVVLISVQRPVRVARPARRSLGGSIPPEPARSDRAGPDFAGGVARAEREIFAHVRRQRWHLRPEGELDALTLAAVLQQHGVPTRLLDVTRDPLVAAFFAAEAGTNAGAEPDGAVVAVRVPKGSVACPPERADAESLDDALHFNPSTAAYALWEPPIVDPRIITQRGCFLVPNLARADATRRSWYAPTAVIGIGVEKPKGGYTGKLTTFFTPFLERPAPGRPPTKSVAVAMIVVPASLKDHLRQYLLALGLTYHSMYPDLEGYAASFPPS